MGLESPVRGKGQGRLRQITSVAKTHLGTMFGGCVFPLAETTYETQVFPGKDSGLCCPEFQSPQPCAPAGCAAGRSATGSAPRGGTALLGTKPVPPDKSH